MMPDGGVDAGRRDSGVMMVVDAGFDAGMMEVDAGPPPPRYVFGNMDVNGQASELMSGLIAVSNTMQITLGTNDMVSPRMLVRFILPGDAGPGFIGTCPELLFVAQYISIDAGTAFYNRNPTCNVQLTGIATDAGETWTGTFSASANADPRSAFDAGIPTMMFTNGSFTVVRQN